MDQNTPGGKPKANRLAKNAVMFLLVAAAAVGVLRAYSAWDTARRDERIRQIDRETAEKIKQIDQAKPPADEELVRRQIDGWLAAQRDGDAGGSFWAGEKYQRLIAVRSWSVGKVEVLRDGITGVAKVRIDSGNEGGGQVTNVWVVSLGKAPDGWKITNLEKERY